MSGTIVRGKVTSGDLAHYDGRTGTASRPDASGGTTVGRVVDHEVDVLQVFGAGTSFTRATVQNAVTFIGASVATLVFAPGTWVIDDNVTIPANLTCHIPAGCVFAVSAGKTLTFAGGVLVEYPTAWYSGSGTVTADSAQFGVTLRTPRERTNGISVVRFNYNPGNLKRYTTDDGSGSTDVSAAFTSMLQCGEYLCHVPTPDTSWKIASTVTWEPEVAVVCGMGTLFNSTVASGQWTFDFNGILSSEGAGFFGYQLRLDTSGAHGVRIYEANCVHMDDFYIEGVDDSGKLLELNGGNSGGSSWNVIGDRYLLKNGLIGLRMYTEQVTPDCNRNFIGRGHINSCTEGVNADRCNTNTIAANPQNCTEGWDLGSAFKNNTVKGYSESCTRVCVISTSADENVFNDGNWEASSFVNSGGTQVEPHVTCLIQGTGGNRWRREMALASGTLHLTNPNDSGPMRIRVADTYEQDLKLSSHDASDTNFDLLSLRYDASAPYAELIASRVLRLGAASRIRWATADTQSTIGAAGGASALPATPTGYAKISINGTDRIFPYYAVS